MSNGLTASAIRVESQKDLPSAMSELGFDSARPILVILGGAGKMSETDLSRLRSLFIKVLAPVVEELGASLVDGGTDFVLGGIGHWVWGIWHREWLYKLKFNLVLFHVFWRQSLQILVSRLNLGTRSIFI
ncbi:MAG: hypothetical protein AAFV71_01715 [Cyanobacteria bacterium J06633_8]